MPTDVTTSLSKILLPLDGSRSAESIVPYVGWLARRMGASVHLLGVVPGLPPDLPADLTGGSTVASVTQYLEAISGQLKSLGLNVEVEAVEGQPSVEIINIAQQSGSGVIALATRGLSAAGPNMLGITTDRVMRAPSVPVLVVPPDEDKDIMAPTDRDVSAIVVGLDGSETAAAALEPTTVLAKNLKAKVVLLRVVEPVDALSGAAQYYGLVDDHAERYLRRVAAKLTEEEGLEVETVVRSGRSDRELIRVAGEHPGSLLVLSTHGWSDRAGWALGSTTDRVVRTARHPVFVIHPHR